MSGVDKSTISKGGLNKSQHKYQMPWASSALSQSISTQKEEIMASQRYEVTNSMLTSGVPVVLSVLGIRPLEDYERLILKEAKNFIQHAKTGQNVLIAIERGQRIIPDPYAVSAIDRALSVLNAESILKQIGKKFGTSAEMQEVLDNIESVIDQALEDDGMNRNETPEGKLTLASNFFNELTENLLEDQEFPLK